MIKFKGLSDPEIDWLVKRIHEAMCDREGLDPDSFDSHCGKGNLYRPEEIHSEAILGAMKMANSVLIYEGPDESSWNRWNGLYREKPRNGDGFYGEEQVEAKVLSDEELKAIWEAQKERFKKAKVRENVYVDAEGCSYNSVEW